MNENERPLSDATIEAAAQRRAPGHADASLLREIVVAASATGQLRGWPRSATIGRRPVLLAAAALTSLIVIGSLAFVGQPHPAPTPAPAVSFPAAVVRPSVPPTAVVPPPASPSASPSAETCATENTSVLTGAAMPPATAKPMTIPAGVLKVGVYVTAPPSASGHGGQTDVWTTTSGRATRIASINGPDYNIADLDDVSFDGRTAIISVGVFHMSLPGPECADLYAVRTDGSGAVRLTHNGPGRSAWKGTFSHDGRYVAFVSGLAAIDAATVEKPEIELVDMQSGGATTPLQSCGGIIDGSALAWSPLDDTLATLCGTSLTVVRVDTSSGSVGNVADSFDIPTGDDAFISMGWLDQLRILLITAASGETQNGPIHLTTLTRDSRVSPTRPGTWSSTIASDPWLAESMSTPAVIAPDGHAVALLADPDRNTPAGDNTALYAIDTATGVAKRTPGWSDVGWSADSRSLVFPDWVGDTPMLTVYDLASGHRRTYGSVPEYRSGIWRGS